MKNPILQFLDQLRIVVEQLWVNYEKTRKWSLIKSEVVDRHHQMDKLLKTVPKKERLYVGRHILEERLWHLNDIMKMMSTLRIYLGNTFKLRSRELTIILWGENHSLEEIRRERERERERDI